MSSSRLRARRAEGECTDVRIVRDPALVASHLEDAAHYSGGHARELVSPRNEADVAQVLAHATTVLAIGAQSSLTGGATPMGELVLDTSRLNRIISLEASRVRIQAGMTLAALDQSLTAAGRYYPPAPTYDGAFVGGVIATNAAGAATFKYGATRQWVEALTVVLPDGDVLDIERGAVRADTNGFEIELSTRTAHVPVPRYKLPHVPKLSAGYYAEPGMDLIDLFIGSEGTLGVVTEATLRIVPERPARCHAFVPFSSRAGAVAAVRHLRRAARETWTDHDPRGLDVSAIEHMDERCLAILREDGMDWRTGVHIPATARMALLLTLDLPPGTDQEQAYEQLGQFREVHAADGPLVRFARLLEEAGVLNDVQIAVPGDRAGALQLLALREAVPEGVNRRIAHAKEAVDGGVQKIAADVVVPIERLEEMLDLCEAAARQRHLDLAVWGHISDGNLHPNVLPRSPVDMEAGLEVVYEIGLAAIRLGGAPMAEHGVGRNPVKQRLLEDLYGRQGIDDMRSVKRALDPSGKLAPGVIFQPDPT